MHRLRVLLIPFSILYGWVLKIRNVGYDRGWFHSTQPKIKTIAIGNLSLGGTGKTPHIEYIIDLLSEKSIAVLSRGYGRKTKGTLLVRSSHHAGEVGDEPLQIALKFPDVPVIVDEQRLRGVSYIIKNFPLTDLILLDDALQHRKINAGMNILLTTFHRPFTKDYYLPAGNLRDHKSRARDADLIVVTKSPTDANKSEAEAIMRDLAPYSAAVFFDRVVYQDVTSFWNPENNRISDCDQVVLLSAIANASDFEAFMRSKYKVVKHFCYRDHHSFSESEIKKIRNFIDNFEPESTAILTTEKDAMRLRDHKSKGILEGLPIFYLPIGINLGTYKTAFEKAILTYVDSN